MKNRGEAERRAEAYLREVERQLAHKPEAVRREVTAGLRDHIAEAAPGRGTGRGGDGGDGPHPGGDGSAGDVRRGGRGPDGRRGAGGRGGGGLPRRGALVFQRWPPAPCR